MKNAEQFTDFLRSCKEQQVKRIHLAEPSLIINPTSGNFGSIIIEFERYRYFIFSRYLPHKPEDEEINEFFVKRFSQFDELIEDEWSEKDIYLTISDQEYPLEFITEMVDADGHFNGMEWKCANGYLFFRVKCPIIAVIASQNEELKYFDYPHQFGEEYECQICGNECFELFPDA